MNDGPLPEFAKVKLEELPDKFARSEAHAQCQCLAHAWFLRESYRIITQDRKASFDWDKTSESAKAGIRRIFPPNEAEWLIQMSQQAGKQAASEAKEINDREHLGASCSTPSTK